MCHEALRDFSPRAPKGPVIWLASLSTFVVNGETPICEGKLFVFGAV